MPINSDKIKYLCGSPEIVEGMSEARALPIFSERVCGFLAGLSETLLKDKAAKSYPDIITFAFFCRKAAIQKEKENYSACLRERIGRGVTFHIAPSNVPINFAYTMVAGLLAGNACVVRASNKPFAQTEIVCRAIRGILSKEEYEEIRSYLAIVQYEHDAEITQLFSSLCNIRVVWGGDATIEEIRNAKLNPRAFDVTFADRYSFCVIRSEDFLKNANAEKVAADFYNDTYLYDQNACSSPRLMIWIGTAETNGQAKKKFWDAVYRRVKDGYAVVPVLAVDKLTALCRCAIDFSHAEAEPMPDNRISRISVKNLRADLPDYRCAGGSFIEYEDVTLDAVPPIVTEKYQTLSYSGFQAAELQDWVVSRGLRGIDRIVPIGKTADFKLIWDGYDLIRNFSRIVYAE